jgi:NitT/TauT family transport system substrate-binding protein
MPRFLRLLIILAPLIFVASCGVDSTPPPIVTEESGSAISLFLGNDPNVQYAPFYAAEKMGFFQKAHIVVTFDYGMDSDGLALVAAGEIPFTIATGDQVLLARADGLPVISVLSWYHDTPIGLLSSESQDLLRPEDLIGKHIGLPARFGPDYLGLYALLESAGIKESDITLDLIGFNQVDTLRDSDIDAVVGDIPSLSIPLFVAGYPVNTLPVADALHMASFGLVTNEDTLRKNPDLVSRMVGAVISGIRFTIAHPEDAFEWSESFVDHLGYANAAPQMDILEASILFYQGDPLGYAVPQAWENTHALLLEMGLLTTPLDLSAAFSNDFIRK